MTESDLLFLNDPTIFVRKHHIIAQLVSLLERCKSNILAVKKQSIFSSFIGDTSYQSGKIAKGENYRFQPYLVLDCPATFDKKNIIAYRIFCWWGHYFSCSWLFQGEPLAQVIPLLQQRQHYDTFCQNQCWVCTDSLWHHAVEPSTHQSIAGLSEADWQQLLAQAACLKITTTLSLSDWQLLPTYAVQHFLSLA